VGPGSGEPGGTAGETERGPGGEQAKRLGKAGFPVKGREALSGAAAGGVQAGQQGRMGGRGARDRRPEWSGSGTGECSESASHRQK